LIVRQIAGRDKTGAEARFVSDGLRGAEAPLFHGTSGGRGALKRPFVLLGALSSCPRRFALALASQVFWTFGPSVPKSDAEIQFQ